MKTKFVFLWILAIAGGAAAASWQVSGMSGEGEMKSRTLALGGARVFETANGTIITDSASKARWADQRLEEAVAHFIRIFGVPPGRGVIVEMPYASYAEDLPGSQRRWTLPWMPRYFGSGNRERGGPSHHHFDNDSGLRHELNHLFFTAAIVPSTKRPQYGGDAPDWLDEAVALTAESPNVKARRRADFSQQVCAGRLVPLEQFVAQQHPLFASPAMRKFIFEQRAAAKGAPAMVTVGEKELDLPPNALADFYAQSNALADFLVADSGDPKILARIAHSLPQGPDRPNPQGQSWLKDVSGSGDPSLGARFAAWAHATARAGTPDCNAGALNV